MANGRRIVGFGLLGLAVLLLLAAGLVLLLLPSERELLTGSLRAPVDGGHWVTIDADLLPGERVVIDVTASGEGSIEVVVLDVAARDAYAAALEAGETADVDVIASRAGPRGPGSFGPLDGDASIVLLLDNTAAFDLPAGGGDVQVDYVVRAVRGD